MAESKLTIYVTDCEPDGENRFCGKIWFRGGEVVRVYAGDRDTARQELMAFALDTLLEKTLELDRRIAIGDEYVEKLHAEITGLKKERDDAIHSRKYSDGLAKRYTELWKKANWIAEERRLAYLEQVAYIEYLQGRLTKKRVKFIDDETFAESREVAQS